MTTLSPLKIKFQILNKNNERKIHKKNKINSENQKSFYFEELSRKLIKTEKEIEKYSYLARLELYFYPIFFFCLSRNYFSVRMTVVSLKQLKF